MQLVLFTNLQLLSKGLIFLMNLKMFSLIFSYPKQSPFCLEFPTYPHLICNLLKTLQMVYPTLTLLMRKKLSSLVTSMLTFLDRKQKLIHKKGYRFSNQDNYSTSIHLTKNYNQLLKSNGLTQLINEPTRKTDATESLLDHILVNTPDKISQSGVIKKAISDHETA